MPRVKRGFKLRRRRKRLLSLAKGFTGPRSKLFRIANETVARALKFSYRDRRTRKRDFRSLWIIRINAAAHNPLKSCISCHNPHDPKPPSVPQECEACHGEIARTKAVSPHVLLTCTTCHTVPDQHKVTPRLVRAAIPAGREFCGKCHAQNTADKDTPKIDLAAHGGRYLCWQCHYPHMPEVK